MLLGLNYGLKKSKFKKLDLLNYVLLEGFGECCSSPCALSSHSAN